MKKLILLISLVAYSCAQNQDQILGFFPSPPSLVTPSTFAESAAASAGFSQSWLAVGVFNSTAQTLNNVWIFASAITGTLGASDLVCDVYSATVAGTPGSSLATTAVVAVTPTAAAWVEFTGFSFSMTANTAYWLVFRNANSTPTSNFPTYQVFTNPLPYYGTMGLFVGNSRTSVNGGSSFSSFSGVAGIRMDFAGPVYAGLPIQSSLAGLTALRAFGSPNNSEPGIVFTLPSSISIAVSGVSLFGTKTGTPTGNMTLRIYTGASTTFTAESQALIPGTVPAANASINGYFSSPVTLTGGTVYRITLHNSAAGDTSTNSFILQFFGVHANTQSATLMPWGAHVTLLSGSTPSWNDATYAADVTGFGLILSSTSGGGSCGQTSCAIGQ